MSIDRAEQLKEKLTDKYVVVDQSIPELRRFANWTGKVKTVNMSCRALVEFDGPVDIGWYDINPDYLTVVDGPRPKAAPAAKAHAPAAAAAVPAAKPVAKPAAAGKSPLDAIRAQQAAKAGAPAAGGAKPSPLDMIRKMGAAKAKPEGDAPGVEAAPTPVAAAEPAPAAAPAPTPKAAVPTTGPDGKPLSKLDLIRMQGAKKS